MPEFKIKNLMIDVVSGVAVPDLNKLCLYPTKPCWLSNHCFRYISPCHPIFSPCPFNSNPCTPIRTTVFECQGESVGCAGSDLPIGCAGSEVVVIDLRQLAVNPAVIKEVQAELDEVLKAAEARGVELNKAMAPQTLAQAEAIETELKAALEEIQRMKGTLK